MTRDDAKGVQAWVAIVCLLVALLSDGGRSVGAALCFGVLVWDMSRGG